MKKILVLLSVLAFAGTSVFAAVGKETKGPFGYNLYDDINRNNKQETSQANVPSSEPKAISPSGSVTGQKTETQFYGDQTEAEWLKELNYYPGATLSSAVAKYKRANYSGSLQELISLTKKQPKNPLVYYYLGMAYAQVGNKDQAVKAYETAIKLKPERTLAQYALRGRDCLIGGATCSADSGSGDEYADIDKLIKSPYGNGFSQEVTQQDRERRLKEIQKTINQKQNLEDRDIEKIQKFDRSSYIEDGIKIAEASDEDILGAIKTLKEAGVNVTISPVNTVPNQYNDISMMLGTSNNNNNAMNMMIPYMMNQQQKGQNLDPQVMQALMMNSMLPDFTFSDNDKRY